MEPGVSVVVTARDEQRYIGRALRSLRRQTFTHFEVVVVDDGSTDRTAAIVARHAREDPRIRAVSTTGIGMARASNLGLAECRAPLVARLDADDVSLPRRLQQQVEEFGRNPRLVALGTYGLRVNELGIPVGRLRNGHPGREAAMRARARSPYVNLTHSSVMYRRDAAQEVGGYPTEYRAALDLALFNRLAELGEVYALPQILTLYTVRRGSVSARRMLEQEMAAARVREEVASGRRFPSFPAFYAAKEADPAWSALQEQMRAAVVRRQFGRYLANGQTLMAARLLRESGRARAVLRATLQRVRRG